MRKKYKFILLLLLFLIMIFLVVFSRILFPNGYQLNVQNAFTPPRALFLFGTDHLGRDVLHRTFNGMRVSLAMVLVIQILSLAVGATIGSIAGYYGGIIDKTYSVIQNVLMSFPSIIASLSLITLMGPGIRTLIIALSVMQWVTYARLVRSQVITIKESEYILGAKMVGASNFYLLYRYIIPNVIHPIIPVFTLMLGHTVIVISGLGFLGFGVQLPTAEIGSMISDSMTYLTRAPWLILSPGITLAAYVFVINLLSESIREMMNPHEQTAIL